MITAGFRDAVSPALSRSEGSSASQWACASAASSWSVAARSTVSAAALYSAEVCTKSTALRLSSATLPEAPASASARSEEHTSELQTLMRISYAVYCVKKKQYTKET